MKFCSSRDGNLAASSECSQKTPLCGHGDPRGVVVERLKSRQSGAVIGAAHDAQGPLPNSRNHHIVIQYLSDLRLTAQTLQARDGQDNSIEVARSELAQASVDVSTQRLKTQGRESMPQLNLAAQAARADLSAGRQVLKCYTVRDKCIT